MRHSYKRIFAMVLAVTVMTGLTACGGASSAGVSSSAKVENSASDASGDGTFTASGKTLNVGVQSNIISIPTVYAKEKGYFDELGLDVNLIMFPNGSPENEGLAAEQLDLASNGLASVYSTASGLCDWIAESDSGSITAKVYVRKGSPVLQHKGEISGKPDMYGSADTLKGLTVLGPTSTMEQWIANSYFAKFNLSAGKDYEYLNMDRAAAAQAILTGEGDVFVATDVDYCNMMESNNMVQVANCIEATDTEFQNGFLVRKDILKDRYDDVVLFLRGMYKAAEELQADPDLRNQFARDFYTKNGKPANENDVKTETKIRPFIVPSDYESTEYALGSGLLQGGNFFASIGTIEEDQVANIESAINVNPLQDALGIKVKAATLK